MPIFRYKGYDPQGKAISGNREADNARSARALLKKDGVVIFELEEMELGRKGRGKEGAAIAETGARSKLSGLRAIFTESSRNVAGQKALPMLTRQLATLLKAGVQLSESLSALIEQTTNPHFKQVLVDIKTQVNEGRTLSSSLAQYPKIFPQLYVSMISVGEAAGNLEVVLFRLAEFLDNQGRLRSKVTSALAYPILMGVVGTGVMTLLMLTIVPEIKKMYNGANQTLPLITQIVTGVSGLMLDYWYVWILVLGLLIFGFVSWKRSEKGQLQWDAFILKIWVIGPLARMIAVSRFTKTLATMLASGVPLLRAMEIVKDVLQNRVLSKVIEDARNSIREGESIAQPLKRSGQFPSIVCNMIAVGERSGQLETMLENVSSAFDVEVDASVSRFTSLLEPIMIILLGLGVGTIVAAIMMPIMQVNNFEGL